MGIVRYVSVFACRRVNGNRIRRLPPHGLDLTSLKHL